MAQFTKILNCMSCGSESIMSYEPEFGEPIFCPFCSEELIDEDILDNLGNFDDDDDDEDDYYEDNPLDERIMEIDLED